MRSLVTGAAGFIGSHLTDALLAAGHSVIGVDDLSTGRLKNLDLAQKNTNFSFLEKSVVGLKPADLPPGGWTGFSIWQVGPIWCPLSSILGSILR